MYGANSASQDNAYRGAVQTQGMGDPIGKAMNIHELLNVQGKTLAEAHAVLDQLFDRLRPVLMPLPTSAPTAAGERAQPGQISARIADHTSAIHLLSGRLQLLLQQLEV